MISTTNPSAKKRGRPRNETCRQEIIAVAGELFLSRGLRATTMESIARALSISKLTLYSRFESKDALFAAVIENKCGQYIPNAFFEDFHKYPIYESLYRVAYGLMNLLTSSDARNMERMLMAEANDKTPLIQSFYKAGPMRVKVLIAQHLERLNAEGKLNVPDAMLATHLFTALIKGSDICMRLCMGIGPEPCEKDKEDYCSHAVKLFMKAHRAE